MKISNFSAAVPFAVYAVLFPVAIINFRGTSVFVFPTAVNIFLLFCTVLALFLFWARGKYYLLNEEGICHKFLGVCYRVTPWEEIGDIMRSKNPLQSGLGMSLVVTVKGTEALRQDAFYGTRRFYKDFLPGWLRGKRFVMDLPKKMDPEEVIGCIRSHYGPLDFDCFRQ